MSSEKQKTHKLSLKGSAKLVSEFFEYCIHTILYQRGVYPAEDFSPVKKYGLTILVSVDDRVKSYIKRFMSQLNRWLLADKITRLVIVITSKESGQSIERWQFDIVSPKWANANSTSAPQNPSAAIAGGAGAGPDSENVAGAGAASATASQQPDPTEAEIQSAIQAIFRQITASVTFLPQLDEHCTFNVLVYADHDSEVPIEWGDTDEKAIHGGESVQLRSWRTGKHEVGTVVEYRVDE